MLKHLRCTFAWIHACAGKRKRLIKCHYLQKIFGSISMVMIKLHAALPTSYTCFKTASSSCLAALCPRLLLGGRGKHVDLLQNHQNETHRDNALDEFRFVIESAGMKQPSKRNSSSWGYQDVLFRKELYRTMAHTHTLFDLFWVKFHDYSKYNVRTCSKYMSYLFKMFFRENEFHETTMRGHETTMKTCETSVLMHAPEKNKKCSKMFELVSCFLGSDPEI